MLNVPATERKREKGGGGGGGRGEADRKTDKPTDRKKETDRNGGRETDSERDRQTDRPKESSQASSIRRWLVKRHLWASPTHSPHGLSGAGHGCPRPVPHAVSGVVPHFLPLHPGYMSLFLPSMLT